jgi:hypothetical protein
VNAEFNWWLLIVGLVIGAGLVYLVLADSSRRDADVLADELPREATWIAASMRAEGRPIDPPTAERVLELHRAYLSAPPPDPDPDAEPDPAAAPPEASDPAPEPDRGRARRGGSAARNDTDVQRDAPKPEPPDRHVTEPRGPHHARE